MRSGVVVSVTSAPRLTSDQRRSGACGVSALQCASSKAAKAKPNVGCARDGSPAASAQSDANEPSSSIAAHMTSTFRSKLESSNVVHRLSSALTTARSGAGASGSFSRPA